jgi:hypothetical protein
LSEPSRDVLEVPLLDRKRPVDELTDASVAGTLVQLADDRPVADLAGLGHGQELEAVERVVLVAEIGLHHLAGLLLGLASRVEDRRLLALDLAGVLQATERELSNA